MNLVIQKIIEESNNSIIASKNAIEASNRSLIASKSAIAASKGIIAASNRSIIDSNFSIAASNRTLTTCRSDEHKKSDSEKVASRVACEKMSVSNASDVIPVEVVTSKKRRDPPVFDASNEVCVGRHPVLGYQMYNPKGVGLCYQLTAALLHIFEKNNIPFFPIGGTILGAVRHGGHIPWDDDEDFAVSENEELLCNNKSFLEDLNRAGLCISKFYFGYKVFSKEVYPYMHYMPADYDGESYYWPFIDLFSVKKEDSDENKWVYTSERARHTWPDFYMEEELYDENGLMPAIQYGPIRMPLPVKSENILDRGYSNWRTHCKTGWDDVQKQNHEGAYELVELTNELRQPANFEYEPRFGKGDWHYPHCPQERIRHFYEQRLQELQDVKGMSIHEHLQSGDDDQKDLICFVKTKYGQQLSSFPLRSSYNYFMPLNLN